MASTLRSWLIEAKVISKKTQAELEAGAEPTLERLVNSHLILPFNVAIELRRTMGFLDTQQRLEEAVAVGNLKLIEAAETYDPTKGKFVSYAWTAIRRAILESMAADEATGMITEYRNAAEAKRVAQTREKLREAGKNSTPQAIGRALGMQPRRVLQLLALAQGAASLDEPILDDDGDSIPRGHFVPAEDAGPEEITLGTIEKEERQELIRAVERLSPQHGVGVSLNTGLQSFNTTTLDIVLKASSQTVQARGRNNLRNMFRRGQADAQRIGFHAEDATGLTTGQRLPSPLAGNRKGTVQKRDSAADIWRRLASRWRETVPDAG